MPSEHHRARLIAIEQYRWFTVRADVSPTAKSHLQALIWRQGGEERVRDRGIGQCWRRFTQDMREEEEIGWETGGLSNSKLKTDSVYGEQWCSLCISFKKIIRGCSAKNHRPRKGRWGSIFWWEWRTCGFLDWTGNGSWLGVRNECHIVQNFFITEVMEAANLLSHHEIIHLSTDDMTTQSR